MRRVLAVMIAACALGALDASGASADAPVTEPIVTDSVADFFSSAHPGGTQLGQSTVTFQRTGTLIDVTINFVGAAPNTEYGWIIFEVSGGGGGGVQCESHGTTCLPPPASGVYASTTTDGNGDATVTDEFYAPGGGGWYWIIDGPGGTTVTGAAGQFDWGPAPAQAITFPTTAARYGQADFSPASSDSGLPVTYSDPHGQCTVVDGGAKVHILAAGSCTVTAGQAGDTTYAPAAPVTQTFAIDKAAQSITFTSSPPATPLVGGGYSPAATAGSGLPVAFSIDPSSGAGVCSISAGRVSFARTGSCVVDAEQSGNGNYLAAPRAQQALRIAAPRLSIATDRKSSRSGSAVHPGIDLDCISVAAGCTADVEVSVPAGSASTPANGRPRAKTALVVGEAKVALAAGASEKVAVTLNRLGRELLLDHRRLPVVVRVIGRVLRGQQVTASKTIVLSGRSAQFAVSSIRAARDGTISLLVRVTAPGQVQVLVTAWKDNLLAGAARLLKPAPGRFVYARAVARVSRPGVLTLRVKPGVSGRRLLSHPSYPIALRLWVSYIPIYGFQTDTGYYGLHLGGTCNRCTSRTWP